MNFSTFTKNQLVITQLNRLFNTLEVQRNELLQELKPYKTEVLYKQPAGKWSIAQILAHLIASEQLSVAYLNKKILGIETAQNTGVVEALKMIALILSQRLPFKFKAPRKIVDNTPVYETMDKLILDWDTTRTELKEVLKKFEDIHLKRKIYRHPIAGMLNIQQALRFLREHIIHHTPQIKNLLKQK
ncbi:MAG: DinB family protein [Cyclobacteriaceae bacterium]|nr:DinB family protein [Cyclobacteriaceae bacterium]